MLIALGWAAAGVVVSVVGILFVGLALNGYTSIGTVTMVLWMVISPGLTTLGGVPLAVGYRLGVSPFVCVGLGAFGAALAFASWVLIFVAVPA
ncbi:MAG: hypothetical protein JRI23_04125 [Deltaproteobacteria bacterium]|nr:hypothetical protein [Deltaproteobacteria bacterium]MBW2530714.1 hypothetical protein [Deltaproteobacteria bacterium]